jgi:hypothetical protein
MRVALLVLLAALLAACDSRAAQVEECVAAYKREAANPYRHTPYPMNEGSMRVACMRAAYGSKE